MGKAEFSMYNEMEVPCKQMANCFMVSPASSPWCPLHPDFRCIFWSLHLFIFPIYSSAKIYIIAWMFAGNISPVFHCNTSSNLLTVFFCKIRYGIWSKKLLPWQTQIPLLLNKGFPFFFMAIMNQEALREGNNIGRLMMMNQFGKTPADLKLPFPPPSPLQPLPVLLMQNKTKKQLQKEAENSPRKIWNNETETEDVRVHSSEWEENTQVDFKAGRDLQTARENVSSSWGRELGWKSSACHKVPLLPLQSQRIHAKVMQQDGDTRAQPSSLGYQSCCLQKEKWEFKKKTIPTWSTSSLWSWNIPAQFSI